MHFLSSLLINIEQTDLSFGDDALHEGGWGSIEVSMDFTVLHKISLFDQLGIRKEYLLEVCLGDEVVVLAVHFSRSCFSGSIADAQLKKLRKVFEEVVDECSLS